MRNLIALLALLAPLFGGETGVPVPVAPPPETRVAEIAALLHARPLLPPTTDRAFWQAAGDASWRARTLAAAEAALAVPLIDRKAFDKAFRRITKDGNRSAWEDLVSPSYGALSALLLGSCVDDGDRYLSALRARLADLASWPTWVMNAHDQKLLNLSGKAVQVDLGAAMRGADVALCLLLLGDRLDDDLRTTLRSELRRRVLTPFRAELEGRQEPQFWMTATHNWGAVCLNGIALAALAAAETPPECAWFLAAAEQRIGNFLAGYADDGLCTEGMTYWNYGYGHFIALAEYLRRATAGGVDLFAQPAAVRAARFPFAARLHPDRYPAFGDCDRDAQLHPALAWFVRRRVGLADGAIDHAALLAQPLQLPQQLLALDPAPIPHDGRALDPAERAAWDDPLRGTFPIGELFVLRQDAAATFSAAILGRHNGDPHNHNDAGSVVIAVDGVPLLCDPGRERYHRDSNNPKKRYQHYVSNSFGQPVPLVAGKMQGTGAQFRARVLAHEPSPLRDRVLLDLRGAYDVPELEELTRELVLDRGARQITVTDAVRFRSPQDFATALITYGTFARSGDTIRVTQDDRSAQVAVAIAGATAVYAEQELPGAWMSVYGQPTATQPRRLGIACHQPVQAATITLTVTVPAAP